MALSEQPDDWAEPGAHPVVPGVYRIPLPMPGNGLKAVNVYAIADSEGLTLVDSGWSIPQTHAALDRTLRLLGAGPADINRFVITHAHHDHYTAAIALRAEYGCKVVLGRGEQPSVAAYGAQQAHLAATGTLQELPQQRLLLQCGAPALAERFRGFWTSEVELDEAPWGEPDTWLDDGDVVDLRPSPLTVHATPGHTRGHIVLRDDARALLFAGDHILPHITPSIGFESAPEPLPLTSYLASLRLVRDQEDTLLLPAHGPVTTSAHARIDELLEHHADRFEQILARLDAGDSTPYEIACELRWTSRRTPLHDLDAFNQSLAVLETKAHLDVLEEQGLATHRTDRGVWHFTTPPPSIEATA